MLRVSYDKKKKTTIQQIEQDMFILCLFFPIR